YTHGKTESSSNMLIAAAKRLEEAGVFSLVLECVEPKLAGVISDSLSIPAIGIGSGKDVDGQVLVINDLLKLGPKQPPSFCQPIADLYQSKKELLEKYLRAGCD
ncbi:MAG: 3-methyl-2-oxobutanoate hydroxymethyltransferase, partial [Bacteriovoracaceae bacterium]